MTELNPYQSPADESTPLNAEPTDPTAQRRPILIGFVGAVLGGATGGFVGAIAAAALGFGVFVLFQGVDIEMSRAGEGIVVGGFLGGFYGVVSGAVIGALTGAIAGAAPLSRRRAIVVLAMILSSCAGGAVGLLGGAIISMSHDPFTPSSFAARLPVLGFGASLGLLAGLVGGMYLGRMIHFTAVRYRPPIS
jgi:MFS family permease